MEGVLAQIVKFVPRDVAFGPEVIAILAAAFDKAIAALHDRGQQNLLCEVIAKRIIALALKGERDPDRLYRAALIASAVLR